MKIYSLTGVSGSGKSYQAPELMMDKGIEALIDDGLFIYEDSLKAGISAKRQKTKIGAIKTALFNDEKHAEEVRRSIRRANPKSILIVATSDSMADKIAARLNLPPITERVYIEDITTAKERELADRSRNQQGKHVIPVPTLQLKRDFAGYFLDPQKLLWQAREQADRAQESIMAGLHIGKKKYYVDKTVVRPTYSYLGDFLINDKVITDIARLVGEEVTGIASVEKVYTGSEPDELVMNAVINLEENSSIWETATEFQKRFTEVVEEMTAFNVVRTDVEIRRLV